MVNNGVATCRKLLLMVVVVPPSSRVDKMVLPQSIELPGITQFDNNGQKRGYRATVLVLQR